MDFARKFKRFAPLRYRAIEPAELTDVGALAEVPHGFNATNPAILPLGDDRLIVVRGVNYVLADARRMQPVFMVGDDYQSVTRCFIVGSDGAVKQRLPKLDELLAGFEDVRLAGLAEAVFAIGSRRSNRNNSQTDRQMMLIKLNENFEPSWIESLMSPFGFQQEKNWIPFIFGGNLCLLYSISPLVLFSIDWRTGDMKFFDEASANVRKNQIDFMLSGSAATPLPDGRVLVLLHRRKVTLPKLDRIYLHRFATLDPATRHVAYGDYFSLGRAEIQFGAGLEAADGAISVAYGSRDREALIAKFDVSKIEFSTLPAGVAAVLNGATLSERDDGLDTTRRSHGATSAA